MVLSSLLASSKYIIVNKDLIKILGLNEAIILGELCSEYNYWESINQLEDKEYFYSTRNNIFDNTGINSHYQRIALKNLENKQIISSKRMGIPCKNYYKINEDKIIEYPNLAKQSDVHEINNKKLNLDNTSESLCNEQAIDYIDIKNNNINNNKEHTQLQISFDDRIKYAEKVIMTKEEYKDLINTYGEQMTKQLIEQLNLYKKANKKEYDNDYSAILRWVVDRVKSINKNNNKKPSGNYEQETFPPGFFDCLYSN